MKIQSSLRRPASNGLDTAKLINGINTGQTVKLDVDVAEESRALADNLTELDENEQREVGKTFQETVEALPAEQRKSVIDSLGSKDQAILAGGVAGVSVGLIATSLRSTNNPYLFIAGCVAGGLALGYGATKIKSFSGEVAVENGKLTGSLKFKG